MATSNHRPLSPHLRIYRLPLLAKLSITHRITGFGISLAAVLMPLVLSALAWNPSAYQCLQAQLSTWYGRLVLVLISAGLIFHTLNGLRHLVWDTGRNLAVPNAQRSGYAVILLTIVLTVGLWLYVCGYYRELL
ncbi:MAG TPA: succinate dehydrogenase, cytochrome b556 subunit [Gammaproteobacteria bacterium]|nr:succinate dehydrogenase, cytochrome b556 subunit [Gammaproteobacteria bacterium]